MVNKHNCMYCNTQLFGEHYMVKEAIKPPNVPHRWSEIGRACIDCIDINKKPFSIDKWRK